MGEVTVKTNHVPRELMAGYELPGGVLEREFDYLDTDEACSPRFFQYRGSWHDSYEFFPIAPIRAGDHQLMTLRIEPRSPLLGWDGYQSDSFFSGLVLKWARDDCGQPDWDRIIVGRYFSVGR